MYDVNELDDDDLENDDIYFPTIGLYDFFIFDLLLLTVIPGNMSNPTRVFIAFGCIICVQIGDLCTDLMIEYFEKGMPAIPFPMITVTAYAIIIDAIIQYSNTDCENLLT